MAIRQCVNHHFYDDEKYEVCPICLMEQRQPAAAEDKTLGYTVPLDDDDKTIGYCLMEDDTMAKPTVGWLVCVKGGERGRDWRLHEGRNDIGTTADADVLLADRSAEKRRFCSVIYDGKHREFLVMPGTTVLVYHNGVLLTEPEPLQDGDEIGIGGEEVLLCFQSFCGKNRTYW